MRIYIGQTGKPGGPWAVVVVKDSGEKLIYCTPKYKHATAVYGFIKKVIGSGVSE